MSAKTEKRLGGTAQTLGLVNIGLAVFLALLVLMPPVQQATATGPVTTTPPNAPPTPPPAPPCERHDNGLHLGWLIGLGNLKHRHDRCEGIIERLLGL